MPDGHHPLTHHMGNMQMLDKVRQINELHMKLFAEFLVKLKNTKEGDSQPAGPIADRLRQRPLGRQRAHARSTADDARGPRRQVLTPGRHIIYQRETPVANLFATMIERVGVRPEHVGDSTGRLRRTLAELGAMPQNPFGGPQPLGVVYNTSMSRPDAALALAELYAFQGKREARIGVGVRRRRGAEHGDLLRHRRAILYARPAAQCATVLPVGLAAVDPLPPDPPMVRPRVERKTHEGAPQYTNDSPVADTSLAEAVLRNGVIFNAEAVVVLSAPATYLAKSLDLLGTKELYKERVKRLVIVDAGAPQQDVAALRKVLAEWPTPIFYCGREVGEALPFPGASLAKEFAWADAHPVVDAYRAFKPMPYDAPSHDWPRRTTRCIRIPASSNSPIRGR